MAGPVVAACVVLDPARTDPLLGVDDSGTPNPGATPSELVGDEPGYADTWFDLERKTMASSGS